MAFKALNLSENVLRGVQAAGYTDPTPIQLRAIPVVLGGGDLIASAQTGTGKTAAFALPGIEAQVDDALMELDYGEYEGLTTGEILAKQPGWDLFSMGCPGGERPDQFAARCDAFSQTLVREAAGRAVVAFTHGHLSRVLTARLLGLPSSTAAALFNETASVSVINVHRRRWVLVGWNIRAEK
jgi:broad specificity phosphatase PhoE